MAGTSQYLHLSAEDMEDADWVKLQVSQDLNRISSELGGTGGRTDVSARHQESLSAQVDSALAKLQLEGIGDDRLEEEGRNLKDLASLPNAALLLYYEMVRAKDQKLRVTKKIRALARLLVERGRAKEMKSRAGTHYIHPTWVKIKAFNPEDNPARPWALVKTVGMDDRLISTHTTKGAAEKAMRKAGGEPDSMFTGGMRIVGVGPSGPYEVIRVQGRGTIRLRNQENPEREDFAEEEFYGPQENPLGNLPKEGARQWEHVYESALKRGQSESAGARQAWCVVKRKYYKKGGRWILRKDPIAQDKYPPGCAPYKGKRAANSASQIGVSCENNPAPTTSASDIVRRLKF